MPRSLDEKWVEKYRQSTNLSNMTPRVFTGFNINIDVLHKDEIELDQEAKLVSNVKTMKDLKKSLKYCKEHGENHEVDYSDLDIEGGKKQIGGQAGIISNFIAESGGEVIMYSSLLSEEISEMMSERILFPVREEETFYLKNIQDAVNSDIHKENHIFEFQGEISGRLILSGKARNYGPYMPQELEEEIPLIQSNIDCCIFSGFHNVTGNKVAKIKRSKQQLSKINKPKHIEFVHKNKETSELVLNEIMPEADSIGLDETELKEISEILGYDVDEDINFGEAYSLLKNILDDLGISRAHLHTYNFHISLVENGYEVEDEKIRDSMLYGEFSAIKLADTGSIPTEEDLTSLDMSNKSIKDISQLEDFEEFHNLDDFSETGIAEIEGYTVVGIPIIRHKEPERTVGMGDIISSGAFSLEYADE